MLRGLLYFFAFSAIHLSFANRICSSALQSLYLDTSTLDPESDKQYYLPMRINGAEIENRPLVFSRGPAAEGETSVLQMSLSIKTPMEAINLYLQIYDWMTIFQWKEQGSFLLRSDTPPAQIVSRGYERGQLFYRLDSWQLYGWREDIMPERIQSFLLIADVDIETGQMTFTPQSSQGRSSDYFFQALKKNGLLVEGSEETHNL